MSLLFDSTAPVRSSGLMMIGHQAICGTPSRGRAAKPSRVGSARRAHVEGRTDDARPPAISCYRAHPTPLSLKLVQPHTLLQARLSAIFTPDYARAYRSRGDNDNNKNSRLRTAIMSEIHTPS